MHFTVIQWMGRPTPIPGCPVSNIIKETMSKNNTVELKFLMFD